MSFLRTSGAALCFIISFSSAATGSYTMLGSVKATVLLPKAPAPLAWERVEPEFLKYPKKLVRNGIRGCGVFDFVIDENGRATNIHTQVTVPRAGIERASERFLEGWQWHKKTAQAEPQRVVMRIDYCMGGTTQAEADEICAYQATLPCKNERS